MSASRCSSSGCESGWTMYLDQSSFSTNQCQGFGGDNVARVEVEEEEEDLSMVSDASSGPGPPHCCEDDEGYFDQLAKKNKSKKKGKEQYGRRSQQHSYLDDTASSPELRKKVTKNEASMENVLEFSQGFSATHLKGKSAFEKHLGFFQSSLAEKSVSKEAGGFQGRKWK